MGTIHYLGADAGFEAAKDVLASRHQLYHLPAESDAVAEALRASDALLDASMKVHITDRMLDTSTRLQIISCATTGSDHIDKEAAERNGVRIATLRGETELLRNLTPAAELSWALLLACARNLKGACAHVESGLWEREQFPGTMLNGKVLGLVGCGRIGTWMSRYGQAFGMRVLAHDPFIEKFPENVTCVSLEELFREADFVSIHVHLSDATRGLISNRVLSSAKTGVVIVNTSRGAICDEAALLEGLRNGRIGACGVDVLDGEPDISNHPLVEYARNHANMLITPHCGGFSPDAVRLVCRHAAEVILEKLED